MSQPWSPQIVVDKTLAKQLIESQFPELQPITLKFIGNGWNNTVYHVNQKYAFCFPRRNISVGFIEAMAATMPKLAKKLPLPVPTPLFFGKPTPAFEWPFLGYRLIAGTDACTLQLNVEERASLAKPLAHFLKALHSIGHNEAEQLNAKIDTWRHLDPKLRFANAQQDIQRIKDLGLFAHCAKLLEILNGLKLIHQEDVGKKTMIHGDLNTHHMLLDSDRKLCGIIDWGDVCIENSSRSSNCFYVSPSASS